MRVATWSNAATRPGGTNLVAAFLLLSCLSGAVTDMRVRWVPTTQPLLLANTEYHRTVHSQSLDRRTPCRRKSNDLQALPYEVLFPALKSRIEQRDVSSSLRVRAGKSGAFAQ